MKNKLSVTVDEKLILDIDRILENGNGEDFRNKSHLVEIAIKKYLREVLEDGES